RPSTENVQHEAYSSASRPSSQRGSTGAVVRACTSRARTTLSTVPAWISLTARATTSHHASRVSEPSERVTVPGAVTGSAAAASRSARRGGAAGTSSSGVIVVTQAASPRRPTTTAGTTSAPPAGDAGSNAKEPNATGPVPGM